MCDEWLHYWNDYLYAMMTYGLRYYFSCLVQQEEGKKKNIRRLFIMHAAAARQLFWKARKALLSRRKIK